MAVWSGRISVANGVLVCFLPVAFHGELSKDSCNGSTYRCYTCESWELCIQPLPRAATAIGLTATKAFILLSQ